MIRDTPHAVRPERLSTIDVAVHVRRDRQTIEIPEVIVPVDARQRFGDDPAVPPGPRIRWSIEGRLLPDEVVLIFGRSLQWTGPVSRHAHGITLIENVFPHPYSLTRDRPQVLTDPLRVAFPRGADTVGWTCGTVLVRGDDTPWTGSSVLRLTRTPT